MPWSHLDYFMFILWSCLIINFVYDYITYGPDDANEERCQTASFIQRRIRDYMNENTPATYHEKKEREKKDK